MDIYYYGMDDFLKSITIESSMHITTVTVAQAIEKQKNGFI